MNSNIKSHRPAIAAVTTLLIIAIAVGCGGSHSTGSGTTGGSSVQQTAVNLSVDWPSRTRANVANITAPAAALSVVITLTPTGTTNAIKLAPAFNRDITSLAEYTATYASTTTVPIGEYHVHLDFFAAAGGSGSVVGYSDSDTTIASDGSGIGTVSLVSTIASVTIDPANPLNIGVPTQLTFSARTANGDITPVTPGSGSWSMVSSSGNASNVLSLTPDGIATGTATGSALVQVAVGPVTSSSATITVGSGVGFSSVISGISAIGNNGEPAPVVAEPASYVTGTIAGAAPTIVSNNPATVVCGGSLLVTAVTPSPVDALNVTVEGEQNALVAQVDNSTPELLDNAKPAAAYTGIHLYKPKSATSRGYLTKYGYYAKSRLAPGVVTGTSYQMAISVAPGYTGSSFNLEVSSTTGGVTTIAATIQVNVNSAALTSSYLQISLSWAAPVDIDLHCTTPNGSEIYYEKGVTGTGTSSSTTTGGSTSNSSGQNGGVLDLDSNSACVIDGIDTENITWPTQRPAPGVYIIRADLYDNCGLTGTIPYVVTINNNGYITTYQGSFNSTEADYNDTENNGHLVYCAFGTEAELAGLIQTSPNITLATVHPGGQVDNATAAQNITDVANGLEAQRSSYTDPVYGAGPGGQTQLDTRMLGAMLCFAQLHLVSVSEIAGGVHVQNSPHYTGMAFDITSVDGGAIGPTAPVYQQYETLLQSDGGQVVEGPETTLNPHQIHVAVLPPATY